MCVQSRRTPPPRCRGTDRRYVCNVARDYRAWQVTGDVELSTCPLALSRLNGNYLQPSRRLVNRHLNWPGCRDAIPSSWAAQYTVGSSTRECK